MGMPKEEERSGSSSEGDVGLLETRTGGSDSKGGTPDMYLGEEEFLEKNEGVPLFEKYEELQVIAEERKKSVVEK